MQLSLIVACGETGQIGLNGGLPWPHLRRDMAHFQRLTQGSAVIMGRKTWESIPEDKHDLPGRHVIVVSRTLVGATVVVVPSFSAAILAAGIAYGRRSTSTTNVFVAGGAQLYAEALPLADKIHLTKVSYDGPADTWIPYPFPSQEWEEDNSTDHWVTDSGVALGFLTYKRRQLCLAT